MARSGGTGASGRANTRRAAASGVLSDTLAANAASSAAGAGVEAEVGGALGRQLRPRHARGRASSGGASASLAIGAAAGEASLGQHQQQQQENEAGEGGKTTRPSAGAKRRSALSDMTNVQGGAEAGTEPGKGRAPKVARLEAPGELPQGPGNARDGDAMEAQPDEAGPPQEMGQPGTASAVADMSWSLGGAGRVRSLLACFCCCCSRGALVPSPPLPPRPSART